MQIEDRQLDRRDVRTLTLASLGGALEFYDFIVFVFFAAAIGKLFFPPDTPDWLQILQTYGIFAAGYVARPLGGIVMAHFGDLVGRKRMFVFSVMLMAIPTLLIGLMPTYATIGYAAPILLLLFRIAQGAAIGGEAPGAWVFVSEHVPPGRVGLACGMLTGGLTLGILLGSLMALVINRSFPPETVLDWAWRIPFLVGGAFGLIAMYLRRFLEETPVFEAMRARAEAARGIPLKALSGHGRAMAVSLVASWMLTAAIVVLILLAPTNVPKLFGVAPADMALANLVATATLTLSAVFTGWCLDRFGLKPVVGVMSLLLIAGGYALYAGVQARPDLVVPLYAFTGFTVGAVSIVPFVMVNAFPPEVRFSGVSFAYNLAYAVFGALTPIMIGWLIARDPIGPAHYVAFAVAVGTATILFGVRPTGARSTAA